MSIANMLPFFSTAVMFVFTVHVFQRYIVRKSLAFFFWGAGLLLFCLGTFAEAYLAFSWSGLVFRMWYLCGAILTAAWIGQGTLYLLFRRPWVHYVSGVLIAASLIALYLISTTPLDPGAFSASVAVSEQYKAILSQGGQVRWMTPFFNTYGLITIVGGAIYSGYLFWRKHVLPNRVIGNALIAGGTLVVAAAGLLTRNGIGQYLYISELIAAVLMYSGFLVAAAPRTETAHGGAAAVQGTD
jgi:hypothetical protein